jgi:hypothetical protein
MDIREMMESREKIMAATQQAMREWKEMHAGAEFADMDARLEYINKRVFEMTSERERAIAAGENPEETEETEETKEGVEETAETVETSADASADASTECTETKEDAKKGEKKAMKGWNIRKISGDTWEIMVAMDGHAEDGEIIVAERERACDVVFEATGRGMLEGILRGIKAALNGAGEYRFNDVIAGRIRDINAGGMGEGIVWSDSGVNDCLTGAWKCAYDIEYTDAGEWRIFMAVAM